ncbi:MAG: ABC transporter substrate-binding protein [Deltaproteobacteria bacterium]|nr:ABC transporter substrate-binding protein [Deltaproteobacteria bacterium]
MRNLNSVRCLFRIGALAGNLVCFLIASGSPAQAASPRLAEVAKKASQEAEIIYQGPDPATGLPTSEMLRDMEIITEKHFGVRVRIKIDNALSFPASTAKVLAEIKAGAPPAFDLMYQTELSGAPLYKEKIVHEVPWLELFSHITAKDLEWSRLAVINTNYALLPIYNSRMVKPQDVPKTWQDLLDPKWKGKLGMPIYPDPWIILSQPNAWGEQRTIEYLSNIMRLNPKLGRYPEVTERVLSGETPVAWLSQRERTLFHKERQGVPLEVADRVEPALLQTNVLFVPKGARHANAAALVAAAMLTKEGQEIELKYQNLSSMFRPDTPAAQFASKRKLIRVDVDFVLKRGPELSKKITAILIKK